MRKYLLALLLASIMLTGCGQSDDKADNKKDKDTIVTENADNNSDDNSDDGDSEEESELPTTMITLYDGREVSIFDDNSTIISLGNTDQIIDKDTIEIAFELGQKINFPAENVAAAIADYATISTTDDYEEEENHVFGDNLKGLRSWFKTEGQFVHFTLDNESGAENADLSTLPVTQLRLSLTDGIITINDFNFNQNTFTIEELVTAWGAPFGLVVDDNSTRGEGEDYDYDYYWRFNNGYIELNLDAGKLYDITLVQWDTYACEKANLRDIPKFGEE